MRMLEDQIYINDSQNCYSNIGLEAYPTQPDMLER